MADNNTFGGMDALGAMGLGLLNASRGATGMPDPIASMMLFKAMGGQNQKQSDNAGTALNRYSGYQLPYAGSEPVSRLTSAIGRLESHNDYGSVGVPTRSGDRAYGKYQVMGANIPSWTKEILGVPMTVKDFLNNPAAQDAVARSKLGSYLNKYGNINDASSMWFSGRPAHNNQSRDVLGTSVPQYVSAVNRYYGV